MDALMRDSAEHSGLIASNLDPASIRILDGIPPRLRELSVNFTTRCALKCTYCAAGKDGYVGFDAEPEMIESVIDFIIQNKVQSIVVGFYGDTLVSETWAPYVERMIDAGVKLCRMHSAFYRKLNDDEVRVLSRFDTIAMSLDTPDRELQAKIRKGLDVRTLIYNLHTIRRVSLANGRSPPKFEWHCVTTDAVVNHLPDLVAFAATNGVPFISCTDLGTFDAFDSGLKSILDLPPDEFARAMASVEAAVALADKLGVRIDVRILDLMRLRQAGTVAAASAAVDEPVDVWMTNGKITFHADALKPGQTRLCIKPWDNVSITPQGDVFPCCAFPGPLGRISPETGLNEIFANEKFSALRQQLATGQNLSMHCTHCVAMSPASPEQLLEMLTINATTMAAILDPPTVAQGASSSTAINIEPAPVVPVLFPWWAQWVTRQLAQHGYRLLQRQPSDETPAGPSAAVWKQLVLRQLFNKGYLVSKR